jgi:hypothetical protein
MDKVCTKCRIEKYLDCFHNSKAGKLGKTSWCKKCNTENKSAWRAKNPESVAEGNKKQRDSGYIQQWRDSNKESIKKKHHDWYLQNKQRVAINKKSWVALNPDRYAEINRNWAANRKARERASFVESINRETVLKRDNSICYLCEKEIKTEWQLDHIVPYVLGGKHEYKNVACTHQYCNASKSGKSITNLPEPLKSRAERKLQEVGN